MLVHFGVLPTLFTVVFALIGCAGSPRASSNVPVAGGGDDTSDPADSAALDHGTGALLPEVLRAEGIIQIERRERRMRTPDGAVDGELVAYVTDAAAVYCLRTGDAPLECATMPGAMAIERADLSTFNGVPGGYVMFVRDDGEQVMGSSMLSAAEFEDEGGARSMPTPAFFAGLQGTQLKSIGSRLLVYREGALAFCDMSAESLVCSALAPLPALATAEVFEVAQHIGDRYVISMLWGADNDIVDENRVYHHHNNVVILAVPEPLTPEAAPVVLARIEQGAGRFTNPPRGGAPIVEDLQVYTDELELVTRDCVRVGEMHYFHRRSNMRTSESTELPLPDRRRAPDQISAQGLDIWTYDMAGDWAIEAGGGLRRVGSCEEPAAAPTP